MPDTTKGLPIDTAGPGTAMRRPMAFWVLVIGLAMVWVPGDAFGQDAAALRHDTSRVVLRRPPPERLAAFRQNPAFVYDREVGVDDSVWDRWRAWLLERLIGPLQGRTAGRVLRWVLYVVAAAGLGFAVLRLLRMEPRGVFVEGRVSVRRNADAAVEDVRCVDYDAAIARAVADGAYRLAVRLEYLRVLQRLTARNLIDWKPDKTNRVYVDELRRPGLRPSFAHLTALFEYAWYGDFAVDTGRYDRIRGAFDAFHVRLAAEAAT